MNYIKSILKNKRYSFYLALVGAVLSIVCAIVYAAGYSGSRYMDWAAFWLSLIAGVVCIGLCATNYTNFIVPPLFAVCNLVSMCLYINAIYVYMSEVFYGGVNIESIMNLNPAFVFCLAAYLVCLVLSVICLFAKFEKAEKTPLPDGGDLPAEEEPAVEIDGTKGEAK